MSGDLPDLDTPHWPRRLQSVCAELQQSPSAARRETLASEAWLLLNAVLANQLRLQEARHGHLAAQDREDVAAEKALALLRRCEDGRWDLSGRSAAEIVRFLATVARNGLVDLLRRQGRHVEQDRDGVDAWETDAGFTPSASRPDGGGRYAAAAPETNVERRQFVAAVRLCADRLQERARRIWFFRTFYELASKDIARHPDVDLTPGNVDVILQRSRRSLRECLAERGFHAADLPQGCFTALWRTLGSAYDDPGLYDD